MKPNFQKREDLEALLLNLVGYIPYELEQFDSEIINKAFDSVGGFSDISFVYENCCMIVAAKLEEDILSFNAQELEEPFGPWAVKVVENFQKKISESYDFFSEYFDVYLNGSLDSHFSLKYNLDNETLIAMALIDASSDVFNYILEISDCSIGAISNYDFSSSETIEKAGYETFLEVSEILKNEKVISLPKLKKHFSVEGVEKDYIFFNYKIFTFCVGKDFRLQPTFTVWNLDGTEGKNYIYGEDK